MTYRLPANSYTRLASKLLQVVQPQFASRVDDIVVFVLWRAEIDKFVDVVGDALLAHNPQAHDGAARRAYGEPVRSNRTIDVVCSFATPAAVHILDHDGRIAGYMFFQKGCHGFDAEISRPARRRGRDKRHRLVLIEGGFGETFFREEPSKDQVRSKKQSRYFCFVAVGFHNAAPSPLSTYHRGGSGPGPINFLNSPTVSRSRGISRIAFSFASGKSGV